MGLPKPYYYKYRCKYTKVSETTKLCIKKVVVVSEFLQTSVVAVNDFGILLY